MQKVRADKTKKSRSTEGAALRRPAVIAVLIACSLLAAAVAQGGPPRLEQKRLRAADVALAKRTTLRASDLSRGWIRRPNARIPEELPHCPGADLDFSAFTITGVARSTFAKGEAAIQSFVEVYESRGDAVGDFRKATAPKVLACLGPELRRQGRKLGMDMELESARVTGRPAIGDRAIALRVVMSVAAGLTQQLLYMDIVAVQRGRTGLALYFAGTKPVPGRLSVTRSVAARMR